MFTKKFISVFFTFILLLWFGVSISRTFYNFTKLFEDVKMLTLTEDQKKVVTFGSIYSFCKFTAENTPSNSNILLLSTGGKPFYFCRYELYPRKIFFARNQNEVKDKISNIKIDYLLIYQSPDPLLNDNKSPTWDLNNFKLTTIYKDKSGARGGISKR